MGGGSQSGLSKLAFPVNAVQRHTSPRSRGETAHEMSTSNAARVAGLGRILFVVVGPWSFVVGRAGSEHF